MDINTTASRAHDVTGRTTVLVVTNLMLTARSVLAHDTATYWSFVARAICCWHIVGFIKAIPCYLIPKYSIHMWTSRSRCGRKKFKLSVKVARRGAVPRHCAVPFYLRHLILPVMCACDSHGHIFALPVPRPNRTPPFPARSCRNLTHGLL